MEVALFLAGLGLVLHCLKKDRESEQPLLELPVTRERGAKGQES